MTLPVILFDFDGTLADTLDTAVRIFNGLADEFGYQQAQPEDVETFKALSSRQVIKKLGVPIVKLPFLTRRVKAELNTEICHLKPIEGMKEALFELKNYGVQVGILTSNTQKNVEDFLYCNGLSELFDFLYSGITIFGKSRAIAIFLKKHNLRPEQVIYVGDETRDIEAAKRVGLKVIAVAWGFNTKQVLADHHPTYLIHHPSELLPIIQKSSTYR